MPIINRPFWGLFSLYLIAGWVQWHIFLNWDVSLLMHTADRLLQGGQYGIDFFDTDPPLILYLYAIPVLWAKWFSLPFNITNFLYTFIISIISLLLCHYSLRRIEISHPTMYSRSILLPAIAFAFLFPPAMDFAQREHLTVMLTLPYLLLIACRLCHCPLHRVMAFFI